MANRPVLVVRARVHPDHLDDFRAWYRRVHLPHVLAIPGIVGYRGLRFSAAGEAETPNVLSIFLFADESVVQKALGSAEAQQAREDWATWAEHVRELSIQIYAALDARATLRHVN